MAVRPDNRLEDAPMAPVTCARCDAGVEVRKSSWNQTSVHWTGAALDLCEERCTAAQLVGNGGRGLFLACSALSGSIVDAVCSGALQVVDEAP
ncbi:ferredoxin [Mycolicibacterium septicum]|uniref:ferredoxin n=1 Tax=Mycolicibacterium septicum TaxID=98668 RepID=UPI001AF7D409|nr:ferredoxin [Mycolicibacterium septicum]QRY53448.1 ferredoxin [Mycolicibacterium septicum]